MTVLEALKARYDTANDIMHVTGLSHVEVYAALIALEAKSIAEIETHDGGSRRWKLTEKRHDQTR